jgi:sugar/nucleoside kinase (ribokinase family)
MAILVVGSVALDSVRTPAGYQEELLGGSATYFGIAASYFGPVSMVAVVGEDFPEAHIDFLRLKGIDVSGLQRVAGRTFRWRGEYSPDMNSARTLETELNVFADFLPRLRREHREIEFLFLGNIDPDLQQAVLEQMRRPRVVACDTMNYWIERKLEPLKRTLSSVDILLINDAETRQLSSERNLVHAARSILRWGPKILVIKRGEYGALLINAKSVFAVPAMPLERVVDPTGAGDSFAGGFMGYIASCAGLNDSDLRKAVVFGSVMASFNVDAFGPVRLGSLTFTEIRDRFHEFSKLTRFEDI